MADPTVVANFGNPAPDTTVSNLQDIVTQLNILALPVSVGPFIAYTIGSITPAIEDNDKAWVRLDNAGRPIGTYLFYNGTWRIQYSGRLGEVRFFSGDPTLYFDATGLGILGGVWDGFALANGQNGTADLSNTFIATANMNSSGGGTQYNSGWQSFVDGLAVLKTGGAASQLLTNTQLPNIRVKLTGQSIYDGNSSETDNKAIVGNNWGGSSKTITLGDFGSNPTPEDVSQTPVPQIPLPIVPTFYALAATVFVGYS